MINLRDNIWAVDAPDPEHAVISGNTITWNTPGAVARGFMVLPPGAWERVCTSKEATEEQLKDVIPELKVGERYQNYGSDLNKNWLIVKKTA